MSKHDDRADAAALVSEICRRILGNGEDIAAVLADLEQRDADRRAAFRLEADRLQGEIDGATVRILAHEGRLQ